MFYVEYWLKFSQNEVLRIQNYRNHTIKQPSQQNAIPEVTTRMLITLLFTNIMFLIVFKLNDVVSDQRYLP